MAVLQADVEISNQRPLRFLTTAQVMAKLGIRSRSTLLKIRQRGDFPRPRRRGGDTLTWLETELEEWMVAQPQAE